MYREIKCKNCRKVLFHEMQCKHLFINAHHVPLTRSSDGCATTEQNNLFLNEEYLPDWITIRIETEKWSKGRLNCPYCDSRVGGFDFVSGAKCTCSIYVLPSIHIIKSKVDLMKEY
ncbi:hypothetical protein NQ314_014157 [Rhamnusium bicolor]|uniref:Uncharacterized protein n=1 Tax=Rhamnusium bicolor TaxID=1586634 RepID=A0AAV8X3U7_9CUCU|nr:hypothetical protein NQ314_014157 [Rhamnusium bicolor]